MSAVQMMLESSLRSEELEETVGKVQRDISASLVWLFGQVFSQTPTLMIYLMILLSNFIVYSMVGNSAAAAPMTWLFDTIEEQGKSSCLTQRLELPAFSSENKHSGMSNDKEAIWRGILEEAGKMMVKVLDEETARGGLPV